MAINKIIFGDKAIDLTEDTIRADRLYSGYTAHLRTGEKIVGTLTSAPLEDALLYYDYNIGYISNGQWIYEKPTNTYSDIYEAKAGHRYFITLGANVGTRFRAAFVTTDVTTVTSGRVTGVQIINLNSPASYANASYSTEEDGYIIVAKDNIGKTGIKTYVYDAAAWI